MSVGCRKEIKRRINLTAAIKIFTKQYILLDNGLAQFCFYFIYNFRNVILNVYKEVNTHINTVVSPTLPS